MTTALQLAQLARKLTGKFVFRKTLPREFGKARISVTSRSDIRLLTPGFHRSASDLMQVVSLYIKPGYCVWDIGANLGIFSFCASWKAGANGKVCSLEADSFYVELQHKTARSLPIGYAPVIPLCGAVSDRMGILELAIPRKGHSRSHLTIVEGNQADEAEAQKQVVSITANFLLQHWPKPDFVKVDVEGAEVLFLQGAKLLLETVRPLLYIEVNDSNQELATDVFSSLNYRMFALSSNGTEVRIDRCKFNTLAKPAERC